MARIQSDCKGEPYYHDLSRSGSAAGRITITAYPGEAATVLGWINVEGSYTTITGLAVDGSNKCYVDQPVGRKCSSPSSQSLSIVGTNNVLDHNEIYQSSSSLRGNGIGIGWSPTADHAYADNTVVRFNKIHDVGKCDDYDHLIYLSHGDSVQIYDNWMWNDSHGWGVQIYPGPTDARIYSNVIDRAGSGFVFDDGGSSRLVGNVVRNNVVTDSVGISNPDIGFSMPGVLVSSPGLGAGSAGNQVFSNDSFPNVAGVDFGKQPAERLALGSNISSDPQFVDPSKHDYGVRAGSPVASWGLWSGS